MSEINSADIKKLREATGAGMMDCKKALVETKGNYDDAVDWLRKKGLAAAAKKSGRVAAEGLIAISAKSNEAAVIELNAETDFVARNERFQTLAKGIATAALEEKSNDVEKIKSAKFGNGKTVSEEISNAIATIGENMNLRRAGYLKVDQGLVASYIHSATAPGLGKIGVLVALQSSAPAEKLQEVGKQIAMHIAAQRPEAVTIEEVDPSALEREKQIFAEQAKASGKPENIIQKMVEGRVRKYYEEVVLPEQVFVLDGKTKVSQILEEAGKTAGAPIKVTKFVRIVLGEGVEKETTDFAAEVAKVANG